MEGALKNMKKDAQLFTHSKRNANSNYPEIPYLLIRLTKLNNLNKL